MRQRKVLYVVGEGVAGFKGRLKAWQSGWQTNLPDDHIAFIPRPVNMTKPAEVAELCSLVEDEDYSLVILDTLARCMIGADENSAADTGAVLAAMTEVTLCTPDGRGVVLGIHHTGKDGKTIRGSSVFETHPDTVYFSEKDGRAIGLTCRKRKDGPDGDHHTLMLAPTHDSCVVQSARKDGPKLKDSVALVERLFRQFFLETGVSNSELRTLVEEHGMSRSTYYEARADLLKRDWLQASKTGNNPFFTAGPHFD